MKICVIIPAYNEAQKIAVVIRQIRLEKLDVLVVDDGSCDATADIAKQNGAEVLHNNSNKGKGASLICGFKYALKNGCDAVITMDADGQHSPEDLGAFMNAALNCKSGIIIGNRMNDRQNMPFVRVLTNGFMSWFLSLVIGQKIPDTQCGFRLNKKEVLEKINLRTSKYETESEILIQASRKGFKIDSITVKTIYAGGLSHINPFIDAWRFIRFIIGELWITPR